MDGARECPAFASALSRGRAPRDALLCPEDTGLLHCWCQRFGQPCLTHEAVPRPPGRVPVGRPRRPSRARTADSDRLGSDPPRGSRCPGEAREVTAGPAVTAVTLRSCPAARPPACDSDFTAVVQRRRGEPPPPLAGRRLARVRED